MVALFRNDYTIIRLRRPGGADHRDWPPAAVKGSSSSFRSQSCKQQPLNNGMTSTAGSSFDSNVTGSDTGCTGGPVIMISSLRTFDVHVISGWDVQPQGVVKFCCVNIIYHIFIVCMGVLSKTILRLLR